MWKSFDSIPDQHTVSPKAVRQLAKSHAQWFTSNKVNLSLNKFNSEIFWKYVRWKHCKYKEWVSFLGGSSKMNRVRNKQITREQLRGSCDLFVPRSDSFPMNPWPEKKHSFLKCNNFELHLIFFLLCANLLFQYYN